MIIELSQFGTILTSRPAGREAYLATKAYLLPKKPDKMEIDYSGVKVMTPSWLDEFRTPLVNEYGKENIVDLPSNNGTVSASLATIVKSS